MSMSHMARPRALLPLSNPSILGILLLGAILAAWSVVPPLLLATLVVLGRLRLRPSCSLSIFWILWSGVSILRLLEYSVGSAIFDIPFVALIMFVTTAAVCFTVCILLAELLTGHIGRAASLAVSVVVAYIVNRSLFQWIVSERDLRFY